MRNDSNSSCQAAAKGKPAKAACRSSRRPLEMQATQIVIIKRQFVECCALSLYNMKCYVLVKCRPESRLPVEIPSLAADAMRAAEGLECALEMLLPISLPEELSAFFLATKW